MQYVVVEWAREEHASGWIDGWTNDRPTEQIVREPLVRTSENEQNNRPAHSFPALLLSLPHSRLLLCLPSTYVWCGTHWKRICCCHFDCAFLRFSRKTIKLIREWKKEKNSSFSFAVCLSLCPISLRCVFEVHDSFTHQYICTNTHTYSTIYEMWWTKSDVVEFGPSKFGGRAAERETKQN